MSTSIGLAGRPEAHGQTSLPPRASIGVHPTAALFRYFVHRTEALSRMLLPMRRSFPLSSPGAIAATKGSLR